MQEINTKRDTSNRPDHYKKMHADVCVVHDCDKEKLKELGYEFIRYSRPVDQFDRISVIRQDRYLYAWVRDSEGNEFEYFAPKKDEERPCIFENESKKLLLTPGSSIYCDETWVDTKVKDKNGKIHYQKRYMWVIVNMTTKVCCYMLYVQSSQAQGYRRIS